VSLELARAGTPMVVAYDVHPLTRAVLSRLLLTDTVTLVNLVSETRAVPELLGRACRPEAVAAAAGPLLDDPGAQRAAFAATMERLGQGGEPPGLRAARAVMEAL
jgi:lipid-A-disaccharide synthase